jgi:hypothetical protein
MLLGCCALDAGCGASGCSLLDAGRWALCDDLWPLMPAR